MKIRKRTYNEKNQRIEQHFKQWKIIPREEAERGFKVKIDNDREQISLVKD